MVGLEALGPVMSNFFVVTRECGRADCLPYGDHEARLKEEGQMF